MKKTIQIICIAMLITSILSVPICTCAEGIVVGGNDATYGIFFYNKKTGYITDVDRSQGKTNISIPDNIKGLKIVGIASLAFAHYPVLKTMSIPDSITDIADNAFTNSNPIFKCNPNSYAEKWAEEHNIRCNTGNTKPVPVIKKITVFQNKEDMTSKDDEYEACADAEITYNGETVKTDSNGIAEVPYGEDFTVKKEGYFEEHISKNSNSISSEIYLEKNVKTPVIKEVIVKNTNVRVNDVTVCVDEDVVLTANIDWNGNPEYLVYIDNGFTRIELKDGKTDNIRLGSLINRGADVDLVVESGNGHKVAKHLKIKVSDTLLNGDDYNVSFGNTVRDIGSGALPYVDMTFDFDIPNFPGEICLDQNKIIVIFGVDVAEWGYENEFFDDKKGEWDKDKQVNTFKTLKEIIKNTKERMEKDKNDKQKLSEHYNELKKKLKDTGKPTTAKFGFDAEISFTGYAEFTIDQDGIYFSEGGFIFAAEAKAKFTGEFMIWVIPCNWEAGVTGKLEAQLALLQKSIRSQGLEPEGVIEGSVTLKIGVGPGFKDLHANICGSGAIKPGWTFSRTKNAITLDVDLSLFIEAVAWCWSNKFELASTSFRLYPQEKSISLMSEYDIFSDLDSYQLIGRAYANEPSKFISESQDIQLMANDISHESIIKTNTYSHTTPQMIYLGEDKYLLVWVDDDLSRDIINGTYIAYSLFDGYKWSNPQYIDNDGTGDFNPVIKEINGTVYIAWESVNKVLAADAELKDMAASMEIKTAIYDISTNSFKNIKRLTDNNYVDTNISIGMGLDGAVISWKSNSANDIWTDNNANSIVYTIINENGIADTKVLADNLHNIDSSTVIQTDKGVIGAYITDTDNNIETIADNELFVIKNNRTRNITNNSVAESGISEENGNIYFYSDGYLGKVQYEDGLTTEITGVAIPNNNYKILNDGKTVIYEDGIDAVRDVYAVFYDEDSGRWSEPTQLTDSKSRISSVSGFYDENDNIVLAYDKTDITGDFDKPETLFGKSNLVVSNVVKYSDISVDMVYYDKSMLAEGNVIDIAIDVTNNGQIPVKDINVLMTDNNQNTIINADITADLLPGESKTFTVPYYIEDNFKAFRGTIMVSPKDSQDVKTDDNRHDILFDYNDICLERVNHVEKENGLCDMYITVSNYGLSQVPKVVINIKEANESGDIVSTKTINNLDAKDCEIICVNDMQANKNYYIEAVSSIEEDMLGNNSEHINLKGAMIISSKTYNDNVANVSIKNGMGENVTVYVAEYLSDGQLCGVNKEDIILQDDLQTISLPYNKSHDDSIVKIFVWQDMLPVKEEQE